MAVTRVKVRLRCLAAMRPGRVTCEPLDHTAMKWGQLLLHSVTVPQAPLDLQVIVTSY